MYLGLYQHYKGNYYQVIGVAHHEETDEEMVVYRGLYGDFKLWTRPKDIFISSVVYEGQTMPRFQFIRELDC